MQYFDKVNNIYFIHFNDPQPMIINPSRFTLNDMP